MQTAAFARDQNSVRGTMEQVPLAAATPSSRNIPERHYHKQDCGQAAAGNAAICCVNHRKPTILPAHLLLLR